jgi:hypothetical protein
MSIKINQFEPTSISFLEMKKNNIINGDFSKIIYSDLNVSFNGLYIYFQIIPNHIISYINNDINNKDSKNEYNIFYLDSNNFNSNIVNELSLIEHNIIEYYKELYKNNKATVYQLKTQLQTGNIKIYKNEKEKFSLKTNGFRSNSIIKDNSSLQPIYRYYTNTYTNMSFKEAEKVGNLKEMKNYLLKVSGIWENKFTVGITYKIIELGEKIQ